MNELIEQLSHCQVINSGTELYNKLNDLEQDEDWFNVSVKLANIGYHIAYNNLDECYVIY